MGNAARTASTVCLPKARAFSNSVARVTVLSLVVNESSNRETSQRVRGNANQSRTCVRRNAYGTLTQCCRNAQITRATRSRLYHVMSRQYCVSRYKTTARSRRRARSIDRVASAQASAPGLWHQDVSLPPQVVGVVWW